MLVVVGVFGWWVVKLVLVAGRLLDVVVIVIIIVGVAKEAGPSATSTAYFDIG